MVVNTSCVSPEWISALLNGRGGLHGGWSLLSGLRLVDSADSLAPATSGLQRNRRRVIHKLLTSPDTTLIPPGTQYGATPCKAEKGNRPRYGGFANPCNPLQGM